MVLRSVLGRVGSFGGRPGAALVRALACALWLVPIAGCGDDETTDPLPGDPGGTGGTGGTGATGAGSGGGDTGGGGSGGGGGDGGSTSCDPEPAPALPCLGASVHDDVFTIQTPGLCVVASYTADLKVGFDDTTFFTAVPTWGRHGGPLLVYPSATPGSVDLVRLAVPDGSSGAMTKGTASAPAEIPAGAFLGAQAFEPRFASWTAITYTTGGALAEGEIVLLGGVQVKERHAVNGIYAGAIVETSCEKGRFLYTGLGALGDTMGSQGGLYAADSCGMGASAGLSDGKGSCPAPALVSSWGSFSGPVAVDSAGNAIALLTESDMSGSTNFARGFEATTIAYGAPASPGDELFELAGFGQSLATLAPAGDQPGLVLFQPNDSTTYAPLDVVAQAYTVRGGHVVPEGMPATALQLTTPGTPLWMMTDPNDRLWVAVPEGATSRFFVLARGAQ